MSFYDRLYHETEPSREYLMASPVIARVFDGEITNDDYLYFLEQAYYHVRHTTPLLMATGSRINMDQEWLRTALAKYIEEENGHQEWILNDILAAGGDRESVREGRPNFATELMVSYAYDTVNRTNPLAFFGMVFVLEGTSASLATAAAECIQNSLGLPDEAFSYLRSHGSIDLEHIKFFESLMDRITSPVDQEAIIHAANVFYRLYAGIFRSLDQIKTRAA